MAVIIPVIIFQSNIDAKITDDLSTQLDFCSHLHRSSIHLAASARGIRYSLAGFLEFIHPLFRMQPKWPFADGGGTGGAHVVTNRAIAGYNNTETETYKGNSIPLNYNIKAN